MLKDNNENLFDDLATLTEAGISILDAARRVADSHPNQKAWSNVINQLERGNRLSTSLGKNGLVSRFEQEVISVAEFAGRISEGLRNIANSYEKRRLRISRLKSKLYYPFAVLLVGIIVSTILQVSKNPELSKTLILSKSIFWLFIAVTFTNLILNFMKKDACVWLELAKNYTSNEWYRLQFQQVVFGALLWHISSGIDFKTGFVRISKLIDCKPIRKKLLLASNYCGQGMSVNNAIRQAKLPVSYEFLQILMTGEQSGRWEESIKSYLVQNELKLDLKIDSAFEWAPRAYYGLIVLIVIAVII